MVSSDTNASEIEPSVVKPAVDKESKSSHQKATTIVISGVERKAADSHLHDEADIEYGCGDIGEMNNNSSPDRTSPLYKSVKKRSRQDKDVPLSVTAPGDTCLAVRRNAGVVEVLRMIVADSEEISHRKEAVKDLRDQKRNIGFIPKSVAGNGSKVSGIKELGVKNRK